MSRHITHTQIYCEHKVERSKEKEKIGRVVFWLGKDHRAIDLEGETIGNSYIKTTSYHQTTTSFAQFEGWLMFISLNTIFSSLIFEHFFVSFYCLLGCLTESHRHLR